MTRHDVGVVGIVVLAGLGAPELTFVECLRLLLVGSGLVAFRLSGGRTFGAEGDDVWRRLVALLFVFVILQFDRIPVKKADGGIEALWYAVGVLGSSLLLPARQPIIASVQRVWQTRSIDTYVVLVATATMVSVWLSYLVLQSFTLLNSIHVSLLLASCLIVWLAVGLPAAASRGLMLRSFWLLLSLLVISTALGGYRGAQVLWETRAGVKSEDSDRAVELFRTAFNMNQDFSMPYLDDWLLHRIGAIASNDRDTKLISWVENSFDEHTIEDASTTSLIGAYYYRAGDWSNSARLYRETVLRLQRNPTASALVNLLVEAQSRLLVSSTRGGDFDGSLAILRGVDDTSVIVAATNLLESEEMEFFGDLLHASGIPEAEGVWRKAQAVQSTVGLGYKIAKHGSQLSPEETLKCLEREDNDHRIAADVRYLRGLAFEKMRDLDNARAAYHAALQVAPTHVQAAKGTHRLCSSQHTCRQAVARVLSLEPSDPRKLQFDPYEFSLEGVALSRRVSPGSSLTVSTYWSLGQWALLRRLETLEGDKGIDVSFHLDYVDTHGTRFRVVNQNMKSNIFPSEWKPGTLVEKEFQLKVRHSARVFESNDEPQLHRIEKSAPLGVPYELTLILRRYDNNLADWRRIGTVSLGAVHVDDDKAPKIIGRDDG